MTDTDQTSNERSEPRQSEQRAVRENPAGAIDIIRRQQSEIERLRESLEANITVSKLRDAKVQRLRGVLERVLESVLGEELRMNDTNAKEAATTDQRFYRVEEQGRAPDECQCANCKLWTVVYEDSEPTEIGTAYQGDAGKEAAEDLCDLMNMAFDAGKEAAKREEDEARKERLAERWS
jgi:hypothetical protein